MSEGSLCRLTYRLTYLGRSWLHPSQRMLAGAAGKMEYCIGPLEQRMYYLFFPRHGMGLWLTGAEFERSN